MYARFYRWAMDRVDKNGVIALITNNSFINARTFDGFRKTISEEYDFAYVIDLGGNIRELSGKDGIYLNEEHTIFGVSAAVGIAIMFLIKKETKEKSTCQINYIHPTDIRATRLEKLDYLKSHSIDATPFERIKPDKNNSWINLSDSNFNSLIPVVSKDVKAGKSKEAIFEIYSMGVVTARDEWVYDIDEKALSNRMAFFSNFYNKLVKENDLSFPTTIKWSRDLRRKLVAKRVIDFSKTQIVKALYKPFTHRYFFASRVTADVFTENHSDFFGKHYHSENFCIGLIGKDTILPFSVLGFNTLYDLNSLSNAAGGNKGFPLYRYEKSGNRQDNITDWALNLFRQHYQPLFEFGIFFNGRALNLFRQHYQPKTESNATDASFTGIKSITKEDIFHYTYAVLHNPAYRKKYELDLKREFPRLPLYADFFAWSALGKQLMDLHINYETAEPFDLKLVKASPQPSPKEREQKVLFQVNDRKSVPSPLERVRVRPKLKADKATGIIELDEQTALIGVPKEAWEYKLGNRSALEWVLDQYKEKKPSDPTIAEKFNTYRFADYKEQVIDLLKRVCTVSVETVRLVGKLEGLGE